MPYQINWEDHGICVQFAGRTSDIEIAELTQGLQRDARFDHIRYTLHDFRKCEGATFSPSKIEEISAIDGAAAASSQGVKIAVVTDRQDVTAMAKVYMASGLHPNIMRIFSTMDDARVWLNSPIRP